MVYSWLSQNFDESHFLLPLGPARYSWDIADERKNSLSATDHQDWDETDTMHPILGFFPFILVLKAYLLIRKENMKERQ